MKIINVVNTFVFLFATTVVMAIFYEGITLKWYSIVPMLIIITDIAFIIATILNIILNHKTKILFALNLFSILIICVAIIMKILNIKYPEWSLLIWNFYILYFFGAQVLLHINKYIQKKRKHK